jgi:hypothetical protein
VILSGFLYSQRRHPRTQRGMSSCLHYSVKAQVGKRMSHKRVKTTTSEIQIHRGASERRTSLIDAVDMAFHIHVWRMALGS